MKINLGNCVENLGERVEILGERVENLGDLIVLRNALAKPRGFVGICPGSPYSLLPHRTHTPCNTRAPARLHLEPRNQRLQKGIPEQSLLSIMWFH